MVAVPPPPPRPRRRPQDFTGHHPILRFWMRAIEIKSNFTTTSCVTRTPLRQLSTFSTQIQSIPTIPFNKSVIIVIRLVDVCAQVSPVVIKNIVTRARVRALVQSWGFTRRGSREKKKLQQSYFFFLKKFS